MTIYLMQIRGEKGMSIRELSKRSGVAVSHIQSIESGDANPSIKVLCRLAKVLDVPLASLVSCD